jgi:hypothetical protein
MDTIEDSTTVLLKDPDGGAPKERDLPLCIITGSSTDNGTVVMSPGFSMSRGANLPLLQYVCDQGYRVVFVDMFGDPGIFVRGWRALPQIGQLQAAGLQWTREAFAGAPILLTHSVSGPAGFGVAATRDPGIQGHLAVAPALWLKSVPRLVRWVPQRWIAPAMALPNGVEELGADRVFSWLLGGDASVLAQASWATREARIEMATIGWRILSESTPRQPFTPLWPEIQIVGTEDRMARPVMVQGCRAVIVVGAGHCPDWAKPSTQLRFRAGVAGGLDWIREEYARRQHGLSSHCSPKRGAVMTRRGDTPRAFGRRSVTGVALRIGWSRCGRTASAVLFLGGND